MAKGLDAAVRDAFHKGALAELKYASAEFGLLYAQVSQDPNSAAITITGKQASGLPRTLAALEIAQKLDSDSFTTYAERFAGGGSLYAAVNTLYSIGGDPHAVFLGAKGGLGRVKESLVDCCGSGLARTYTLHLPKPDLAATLLLLDAARVTISRK